MNLQNAFRWGEKKLKKNKKGKNKNTEATRKKTQRKEKRRNKRKRDQTCSAHIAPRTSRQRRRFLRPLPLTARPAPPSNAPPTAAVDGQLEQPTRERAAVGSRRWAVTSARKRAGSLQVLEGHSEISPEPSLLQDKQDQLSSFIGEGRRILKPIIRLCITVCVLAASNFCEKLQVLKQSNNAPRGHFLAMLSSKGTNELFVLAGSLFTLKQSA
ncbi:uncharacterized protein LOC107308909 isoform X2 [Coturnix japonica]|uniref:uncharacterized protein LOC107308909 isoform X2 n=1 Tax=Coturnix japonica TaxID=93934 RepID=UPI0013A5EFB5|nr:uncharacterized protein LOC107308909 isoform X2 [Coturnix japonica]